jgi:hypothetical protein
MNDAVKLQVLAQIGRGPWKREGQTNYRSAAGLVHARFKTSGPFSFNINPATLRADYELWICGSASFYYLLPRRVVKSIYEYPDAYVDRRHLEIRVVSVDTNAHRATYGRGAKSLSLQQYFRAKL